MATHRPFVLGSQPAPIAVLPAGDTLIGIQATNNQTGTSYTIVALDGGKLVTFSNAAAIAVALPAASTLGAWWYAELQNIGNSNVTITPTTSTIDGAASFVLGPGQGIKVLSDGTNYSTFRGLGISLTSPAFLGTPTAPTAAVNTNTTQIATTAFVVGQASNATPLMNGTAAVGSSLLYAREDHVHPVDTSRAPLNAPAFTGGIGVTGASIIAGTIQTVGAAAGFEAQSRSGSGASYQWYNGTGVSLQLHNGTRVIATFDNSNDGSLTVAGPLNYGTTFGSSTATGSSASWALGSQALYISGNYTGGGNQSAPFSMINVFDTTSSTQVTHNALSALYISHNINSGAGIGNRFTLVPALTKNVSTGGTNTLDKFFCPLFAQFYINAGDGGSSPSTYYGDHYGACSIVQAQTGSTWLNAVCGGEFDIAVQTGANTKYKVGFLVASVNNDAVHADTWEAMLVLGRDASTTVSWNNGIIFGSPFGAAWPFNTSSTIIGTYGSSLTANYGVDFNAVTFSSYAFRSPGFSVDPTGAITGASITSGPITTVGASAGLVAASRSGSGNSWTWYNSTGASLKLWNGAADAATFDSTGLNMPSASSINFNADTFLTRKSAAYFQLGAADAAAPVQQVLGTQSVVAGTTNTAGALLNIKGSAGTGTGVGGGIQFQVAPAGSTGSAQNAYSTAFLINGDLTASFNGDLTLNANGSSTLTLKIDATSDSNGANIAMAGNGATTPNKFLRVNGGAFQIINSAYSAAILNLTDAGALSISSGMTLAGGTATVAPLTFVSGTSLTTPGAGALEYDGSIFYASPKASNRGLMKTVYVASLSSTYTLASQTAAQKLFNTSTNGAITLDVGTYWFECSFTLTSMSASSGSFGFALGGTATKSEGWQANAMKVATLSSSANTTNLTYQTGAQTALVTANTNTSGFAYIEGFIRITVAGTIIPQVSLGVAAAAVVGANSYFKIVPVSGSATGTNIGNWS